MLLVLGPRDHPDGDAWLFEHRHRLAVAQNWPREMASIRVDQCVLYEVDHTVENGQVLVQVVARHFVVQASQQARWRQDQSIPRLRETRHLPLDEGAKQDRDKCRGDTMA